jgi:Co/Zn/Cd efflux system component
MSAHCHDHGCNADASQARDPRWRRALWVALVVNAGMFFVEVTGGLSAESAALLADAVDFAADAVNYGLSLAVIGLAAVWGSRVAWLKGWAMALYGVGVLAHAGWLAWQGSSPHAPTMGGIGLLALAANLGVAVMLYRFRKGDANAESVWLCSRNDALANAAIVLAALGVFGTGAAWPDLVVAGIIAGLGVSGGLRVLRSARHELRAHAHA